MSEELDRLRAVARAAVALRQAMETTAAARDALIEQAPTPTESDIQGFQQLWEAQMARRQELYAALDRLEELDARQPPAADRSAEPEA
jgi:hypothetical protein